jgi:hypothetical protein
MLKPFSVPVTPQGKSALASMPPWHHSSDCIAIEYWADLGAIEALLPPGRRCINIRPEMTLPERALVLANG